MAFIFPPKLKHGQHIRIVAPSHSFKIIRESNRGIAQERFKDLGLGLSYGTHIEECDIFESSCIESRVSDLHQAFRDTSVNGILPVIGGFNVNQIFDHLDWDLIRNNPKFFGGYSDTTALQNAILAKTGVVTYSSPSFSTFAQRQYFDYTLEAFQNCVMRDEPFDVVPVTEWTDDPWYQDQDDRRPVSNEGFWILHEGSAEGTIIGGNLCTLQLLFGTQYCPSIDDTILFIEDDHQTDGMLFDRDLQSLLHQPWAEGVRGVIIGRFQKKSAVTRDMLQAIIDAKSQLREIPVVANVDFGHTDQMITYPIGGRARVQVQRESTLVRIVQH